MQRVFVGDVQGCGEELRELIGRAEGRFGTEFELWPVGDLINRGPRNREVLEQIRSLWDRGRAFPVLGNHELAFLRLAYGLREEAPDDTFQTLLAAPDGRAWCDWIRGWPLARGDELGSRSFVLVHAAVGPGWSRDETLRRASRLEGELRESDHSAERLLATKRSARPESDDLERLTRCRSVGRDGVWSSGEPESPAHAWHAAWSRTQPDYAVVYGHWARQGLHCAPGLRGLDTGCVYHGNGREGYLTAWIPDPDRADPFAVPDRGFWRVRAKRRYWSP